MEKYRVLNIDSLICPKCKSSILNNKDKFYCSNSNCDNSINHFKSINKKLVLVDYNNSVILENKLFDSIGESKVRRKDRSVIIKKAIFKLLNGSSITTSKNLKFISSNLDNYERLKILIVGGGTNGSGMEFFLKKYSKNITSFDVYYSENVDLIADAHSIPFKSNTFNLIIIQAVLEHVMYPNLVVDECHRVLKTDGLIYAETPFLQHVHEGAYDFTRFTLMGKKVLFGKFDEIKSGYIGGLGRSFLWSIEFLIGGLFRSRLIGKFFKVLFFWIRFFDLLIPTSWNIDGACGVFFIGKKMKGLKHKLPSDYIKEYQGAQ